MNLDYTAYSPGQAVNEYQARLQAQKANDIDVGRNTPEGQVATYNLSERVPNWLLLLDIEKPHLYSRAHLATAIEHLNCPDSMQGASAARVLAQKERFEAALASHNS